MSKAFSILDSLYQTNRAMIGEICYVYDITPGELSAIALASESLDDLAAKLTEQQKTIRNNRCKVLKGLVDTAPPDLENFLQKLSDNFLSS